MPICVVLEYESYPPRIVDRRQGQQRCRPLIDGGEVMYPGGAFTVQRRRVWQHHFIHRMGAGRYIETPIFDSVGELECKHLVNGSHH